MSPEENTPSPVLPEPPSARLFLGLWPAAGLRQALDESRRDWQWPPGARLTAPERLHITLHFLGAVPLARLPQLREGLAGPAEPFTLRLADAELWHGGIAVLCAREVPPAAARLHQRLARALLGLGLPVEQRPWRPHVTLARKAQGARAPALPAALDWQADGRYALVHSLPGVRGYESLAGFG